ncbi:uncharacterized protein LOC126569786 [Anopheles aquasalis]|uniref:uncharacterized protein LOC126569786 n=1 Tax=Anopheles aquasalis TaxID=42839 RepID=UPI00215AD0D4|nr:uncharacterized protein LOC126569786 [Anopheles aquasalis]
MTQLEDDDLLNNLLKIPGTIIIYNNDMSSYDYVLNAHNVTLPLTPATSTAGSTASEQSVDDLNSSASIDGDLMTTSPVPSAVFYNGTNCASQLYLDSPCSGEGPLDTPTPDGQSTGATEPSAGQHPSLGSQEEPMDEDAEEEEGEEEEEVEELETVGSVAEVDDDSEPELTNLSWLTELKNITNLTPSDVPLTDLPTARFNKFIAQVRRSRETYDKRKEQYTSLASSLEKPPFNYAQIIAMAMLEEGRMTLKQICKWIQEKFSYYKVHKNWNNSIRHNLSLSFFFTKVQRAKDEKGKGGYWELSMDVSKSERRRVRVRQRNKSANGTTNSSPAASNRGSNVPSTRSSKGSTHDDQSAGSSTTNNNNELMVNHNLAKTPANHTPGNAAEPSEEQTVAVETLPPLTSTPSPMVYFGEIADPMALDRNNNERQEQSSMDPSLSSSQTSMPISNVTIDIIDNYGKPSMVPVSEVAGIPTVEAPQTLASDVPTIAIPAVPSELNDEQLIRASAMVESCSINFDSIINGEPGASIFNHLSVDEIFSDNEIPQPANDDIIVPFFSNVQQVHSGPNVVVETIPYYLPDMGNFDESDFGNLINLNEQEISDEFLNEHGFL